MVFLWSLNSRQFEMLICYLFVWNLKLRFFWNLKTVTRWLFEHFKCWDCEMLNTWSCCYCFFLKSRLCVVLLFFLVLNGGKLKCWIVFFVCNSVLFEMLIKQHWHFELLKTKKKLCGCLCVFEHLIYVCCFHMLKLWRFEIKHN